MLGRFATVTKSALPHAWQEVLWRWRSLPGSARWRMLATIRRRDLLTAMRARHDQVSDGVEYALAVRGLRTPVVLRPHTSDYAVFDQVFVQQQYGGLPIRRPRLIIDAGANVGLSSVFFLWKYPTARVIAVEPDPANVTMAARNLQPFGSRCELVRGAVWSSRTKLDLEFGLGAWATRVVSGGSTVEGYSLEDLRSAHCVDWIDLLKLDIEGAEAEVFRATPASVWRRVGCVAAELHGETCRAAMWGALAPLGFRFSRRGEITVAVSLSCNESHN